MRKHLSLKGIARKYKNKTGSLSVKRDLLKKSTSKGPISLRKTLENLARNKHAFKQSECIYKWQAAFDQTWSHITVRIKLEPDEGITNATLNTLKSTWKKGIEENWSDKWGCRHSGELTCPFTFQVVWVSSSEHHEVRVRPGPAHSNMLTWDTKDDGPTSAHEYGHMLGHPDEYTDPKCPDRDPVNTGTIMDDKSAKIPKRLMERFAKNISSQVVSI